MPERRPVQRPADPAPLAHIEETTRAITQLLERHDETATPTERLVEQLTAHVGRPRSLVGLALAITAWVGVNQAGPVLGYRAFDPPPFPWLQGLLTVMALFVTLIILTTQRRADVLAAHRDQQILRLSMLAEQKVAKAIALLEENRRDNPMMKNRVDTEALAMAVPADPDEVLLPDPDPIDGTTTTE